MAERLFNGTNRFTTWRMNEMKSLAELQAIREKARAQISVREGQ